MAISANGARFIARLVKSGLSLGNLVTVGRQALYLPKLYANTLLASAGCSTRYTLSKGDPGYPAREEWADELYRHFGAKAVAVLDGSNYEGAALLHDLNTPLPSALANTYDCLLDGGTLEHVFNVPEAISSYMKLIRVGGHVVLLDMPATNACGHGFYQFSPAFFWQIFSKRYGFEMVDLLLLESDSFSPFWRAANPAKLKRRVELVSATPCYMYVVARKVAEFPGLSPMPIQEDYAQSWELAPTAAGPSEVKSNWKSLAQNFISRIAPLKYWKFTNQRDAKRGLRATTLGGGSKQNPYTRVSG